MKYESVVSEPREIDQSYKIKEKGVVTPLWQCVWTGVGVALLVALAFIWKWTHGNLRTVGDDTLWVLISGAGAFAATVIVRMNSGPIKTVVTHYAQSRGISERKWYENVLAQTTEERNTLERRAIEVTQEEVLSAAMIMLREEWSQGHGGKGCGWGRDATLGKHKEIGDKNWEFAKVLLQQSGVASSGRNAKLLIDNYDQAELTLHRYARRPGRMVKNVKGGWTAQ